VGQLDLFGTPGPEAQDHTGGATALRLAEVHAAASRAAKTLPPGVRFGTSSWGFPGWAGLVYARKRSERALARDGLVEYVRHPLLRTVGIDRSYYAPIPESDLRRYAEQLPDGFPCCAKASAAVTSPVLVGASRRGAAAVNPHFLSADRFIAEALEPVARSFAAHAGPFILEVSPAPRETPLDPTAFVEALDAMLAALPSTFRYAVELRDRHLLTGAYARVLARHRASHVYNYWSAMPMPATQAATVPLDTAPFCVVRLLLRPGTWYENQRERFRPFDCIVEPDQRMRADVIDLVTRVSRDGGESFVLVNNKAEGSAPLTIAALADLLAAQPQPKSAGSHARPSSSGEPM
jgi:uncharacterized protein YecE (DUF72 family)